MRFQVGDIIRYKEDDELVEIVKIAEKGESVLGPWSVAGDREVILCEKSYIFERKNKEGQRSWTHCAFANKVWLENEYELVSRADQKLVQTPQQNSSDPFPTLREFLGV
jgi:hypothetical protein